MSRKNSHNVSTQKENKQKSETIGVLLRFVNKGKAEALFNFNYVRGMYVDV